MKKFFALLALVLGVVSCQTEPEGFDVNVGGEQDVNITVSLPEGTRAYADSALGAFGNVDFSQYDVRFQCEVHYNGQVKVLPVQISDNGTTAMFPVRLIANRDYKFVVWADLVLEDSTADLHYNTSAGLHNITINDWNAMDETRDAFTCSVTRRFERSVPINLELTRPFAKLRVITTDMKELMGIVPTKAEVEYTTKYRNSFNAVEAKAGDVYDKKIHNRFEIADYGETDTDKTLFADYLFASEGDIVNFSMNVYDQNGDPIDEQKNFNTAIPVNRNYVTTIKGNILTFADQFTVEILPGFDNAGNIEDAPYHQVAVTNGADLLKAISEGREIIVLNHITVTAADANFKEGTTRAGEQPIYPVLNLNGFTITIENENAEALVNLNGGALTVEGEGSIVSNDGALVEGTTVVTEGATVEPEVAVGENSQSAVLAGREALGYICENGGEFTFTEDLAISEVLLASTTNPIVINGANYTLTSAATRAIRATVANANIVVNDLNIVVTTERVGTNDIRGYSIDNVTGVELTLNNCSVIFSHPSGNDWAYAVNVTGGSNHKVTVDGGRYNGANVINVRGEKQTVIVKNATLTSLYPNNDVYYGACIYVVQNENSSVYAEGNTFNGDNALAFNIGYTPLEEKNNTNNAKRVSAKVNGAYYYNIAEAIVAAEDGATITVLQNHDCNVGATVPAGKTLTIDLNGKTVKGTDTITGSFGLITNKGNLLVKNGTMTLKAENNRGWNAYSSVISNTVGGNLVVENATIEHLGGTDMAYGIDNLTNGKGTYAETTVNNGAVVKSCYRAIRQFLNGIEAQNILTVNAGAVVEGANKSIWMQDPSKNANTGKLVVTADAELKGDAYLSVTAGSTEWPVEVSIANDAFVGESTLLSNNVPAGYAVEKENGVWVVKKYDVVANGLFKKENAYVVTNAEGLAALNAMMVNKTAGKAVKVTLGADIDFAGKTWTPVDSHADTKFSFSELDGKGYTISNLTINGQAMFTRFAGAGDVTIKNVTFDNANVNSKGSINTSILTGHTYQNVLLDNVDVKNSTINGGYKVAPLIATVYNEGASTITATLKNCDVENTVVKATSYDFCTTGMVAFVYEGDNDRIVFENCSVKGVQLYAPNAYTAHAAIYTAGSETLYNEAEGVVVENVTFENI